MATVNRRRTSTGEWRYDVRYRVNGRPVERAFKRRRDAEAFRRRLEADELAGVLVDPRGGRRMFAEVAVEWLASNPGKRPSSWARDEVAVRKHLVPHFGAERIERITASSIQALVNDWSAHHAPGTVKRNYGVVRAILRFAVQRHYLGTSPCRGVHLPEQARREVRLIDAADLTAPRKLTAKLASEAAKPRASLAGPVVGSGVCVVTEEAELAFLHALPVRALWGVGPATAARLERLAVQTVGDLAALPVPTLERSLGRSTGRHLHDLAWARDHRRVIPVHVAKSVGHEETYAHDHVAHDSLDRELAAAMGDYGLMAYVGAQLGLRWGEVAGLRAGRLMADTGTVAVIEQVTRGSRGRTVLGPPKSAAGRRVLVVPPRLLTALLDHAGPTADPDAFVFPNVTGGPLDYANWRRRVWLPATDAADLGGLGFHDLRRACASYLVLDGIDPKTTQGWLGHSDARLTLDLYAQVTSEGTRRAADAMSARLDPRS